MKKYHFFLGGNKSSESSMMIIKKILKEAGASFSSQHLGKRANASEYLPEIIECLANGICPVCIELGDDLLQATHNQRFDDEVILINPRIEGLNQKKSSETQVVGLLSS